MCVGAGGGGLVGERGELEVWWRGEALRSAGTVEAILTRWPKSKSSAAA